MSQIIPNVATDEASQFKQNLAIRSLNTALSKFTIPSAPVTETGATHTVAETTAFLICNRAGTITLTLPSAATFTGRTIRVKTIQAQTVVSGSSDVVPSTSATAGTDILPNTDGAWADLVSDGTNWVIMAAYPLV